MKTRKSTRKPLKALATCRNGQGRQWEATLRDVSEGGCRVSDPSSQIRHGERLTVFMAGTGPHFVEATWRRENEVGLAFRRPLPSSLLDTLASTDWDAVHTTPAGGDPAAKGQRFV